MSVTRSLEITAEFGHYTLGMGKELWVFNGHGEPPDGVSPLEEWQVD